MLSVDVDAVGWCCCRCSGCVAFCVLRCCVLLLLPVVLLCVSVAVCCTWSVVLIDGAADCDRCVLLFVAVC